jgi:hemerythrin superfamily protein
MPNGIDLILADHERVAALFAQYRESPNADVIGQVIDALKAHDDAEQAALYPLLGHLLGDEDMITRAAAAHSAVKKQIDLLVTLEGANLTEAFAALQQLVEAHVADEEENMLPALAAAATAEQQDGLGARILHVKQRVG